MQELGLLDVLCAKQNCNKPLFYVPQSLIGQDLEKRRKYQDPKVEVKPDMLILFARILVIVFCNKIIIWHMHSINARII